MPESLYNQLKSIGIDEELAHEVDKSLSPDHVATRQDFLILQETILQTQLRSENAYQGLRTEIVQLNGKIDTVSTGLNAKIDTVSTDLNAKIDTVSTDLNAKIDTVSTDLNAKIDTVSTNLNAKIDTVSTSLNAKIDHVDSSLRLEIAAISRHFWVTFGGLITTILSVFGVNWYFH